MIVSLFHLHNNWKRKRRWRWSNEVSTYTNTWLHACIHVNWVSVSLWIRIKPKKRSNSNFTAPFRFSLFVLLVHSRFRLLRIFPFTLAWVYFKMHWKIGNSKRDLETTNLRTPWQTIGCLCPSHARCAIFYLFLHFEGVGKKKDECSYGGTILSREFLKGLNNNFRCHL